MFLFHSWFCYTSTGVTKFSYFEVSVVFRWVLFASSWWIFRGGFTFISQTRLVGPYALFLSGSFCIFVYLSIVVVSMYQQVLGVHFFCPVQFIFTSAFPFHSTCHVFTHWVLRLYTTVVFTHHVYGYQQIEVIISNRLVRWQVSSSVSHTVYVTNFLTLTYVFLLVSFGLAQFRLHRPEFTFGLPATLQVKSRIWHSLVLHYIYFSAFWVLMSFSVVITYMFQDHIFTIGLWRLTTAALPIMFIGTNGLR